MADFNVQDYSDYFENIAKKLIAIKHDPANKSIKFFKGTPMDSHINETAKGDIKFPYLTLERLDGKISDKLSDNLLLNRMGAFWIMTHVAKLHDDKQETAAYDLCESIMLDILAKMKADKVNCYFLKTLDMTKVSWVHVGPYVNNHFGVRCQFEFHVKSNMNFKYDSAKWLP